MHISFDNTPLKINKVKQMLVCSYVRPDLKNCVSS